MKDQGSSNGHRLDAIMEAVDAAIVTISSDGIIIDTNVATTRLFGYDKEDMLGSNVKMLMPEPYRSDHDQFLLNHLQTGVNKIIGSGRKVSGVKKTGEIFPVHLSVAKFTDGDESHFTGILHDLTELDDAQSLNSRLGQIIEESVNEVYTYDAKTLLFTSVNRSAQQNLGYSLKELKSRTPLDVIEGLDEVTLRSALKPLIKAEKKRTFVRSTMKRKDLTHYEVEGVIHYTTAVSPPEIAVIVQDVTEKNKLSEKLQQNQRIESIGNLTGGIAHDFNNILTVVSGNLELLQDDITDPEEMQLLTDAREAAEMGSRLTQRLLAFARRSTLAPGNVNVNALIKDISSMLERTLGGSVKQENILADNLWSTTIDASELENALVNLAVNARDAMPTGGRLLIETTNCFLDDELILGKELAPGEYVNISVTDTGTGIPEEIKGSIFEPFVTTKKGGQGTGLGLSMVYGFVRQSGGAITVYSEPDKGTVFSLYLPATTDHTATEDSSEVTAQPSLLTGKKILVAEDDKRVRNLTRKRLKKLGHEVVMADDGHHALALFKETEGIDLVFTDVVMTEGMTGYDLALAVRKLNPDMPVLLASGYAEDIVNRQKLDALDLQLLRKPYNQNDLRAHLEALLT